VELSGGAEEALSQDARTHHGLMLLGDLEQAEAGLLSWGIVDGCFTREELLERASEFLALHPASGFGDPDELLAWLEDERLLWPIHDGDGRFRTRMAETLRLLARLRQIFDGDPVTRWRQAKRLVADFRLLLRPRAFPRREMGPATALAALGLLGLGARERHVLETLLDAGSTEPVKLADFQVAATKAILGRLGSRRALGTIVCAGTGSGKTLAFYLPAFAAMAGWMSGRPWTKCIALYPRNELLKDQLREALRQQARMDPKPPSGARLSIGVLFGDVPRHAADLLDDAQRRKSHMDAWVPVGNALRCPLSDCPRCNQRLLWKLDDLRSRTERLSCESCDFTVGPEAIRLTRERLKAEPPDLLFTTTEMMNQRMVDPGLAKLFGYRVAEERQPRLVLLDEVHTYEGVHGAQVALLLRRWQKLTGVKPHFVGLSATLADAARFFAELVGIKPNDVTSITPAPGELIHQGMEYQVAVRGDPISGAGLLSTSIQTVMLLRRMLEPKDSARPAYGTKVFAFTDNLDVNNRLFFDTLDAEGWRQPGQPNPRKAFGSLATLRAREHPEHAERLADGQSWVAAEWIGHPLARGSRVPVDRVSSLDRGVDRSAEIVVATSSLEVGFDDPSVGAVIQHKAPRSSAAFLQRKGRAGRRREMRPWTVVILSDFGRDRIAYQSYEQIFSPELTPRYLPVGNRHVLKMQAAYALLDWLSSVPPSGKWLNPWTELSAPPRTVAQRENQKLAAKLLRQLLDTPSERARFSSYLRSALDLDEAGVQAILWEAPRGLLTSVVPTWLRRLERAWRLASSESQEPFTWGAPLPDFVPRALFGDLNVPEVQIILKNRFGERDQWMPAAQALREFAPGRVSHRFSVQHIKQRNWLAVPPEGGAVRMEEFCEPEHVEELGRFPLDGSTAGVAVVRPRRIVAVEPPADILSSSNAFPEWRTAVRATSGGLELDMPRSSRWRGLVTALRIHSHASAEPLEVTRYAPSVSVSLKREDGTGFDGVVTLERGRGEGGAEPVALGFTAEVDGLELQLALPEALAARCQEDVELMRGLRPAFFRHLVQQDRRLDGLANRFQRDWLADAYGSALALEALTSQGTLAQARDRLRDDGRGMLTRVLDTLMMAVPATEGDDEASTSVERSRRHQELLDLLEGDTVQQVLHDAATALWAPPTADWEPWLRRRVRATLGTACLGAIRTLCAQIEAGDLLLDLDAAGPDTERRLWLNEAALGGSAVIEEFLTAYGEDPRRFFELLEAVLAPSEFEEIDVQLRALLGLLAGPGGARDAAVARVVEGVRMPGSHHEWVERSTELRRLLAERGFTVTPSLVAAIFARLLRPGSTSASDALLARIVADWDEAEARLGIELDPRLVAMVESERDTLEAALGEPEGIPAGDRRAWRFSALLGLLWPRGAVVRAESLKTSNPYCAIPATDRRLLLTLLPRVDVDVEVEARDWLERLGAALVTHGSAKLTGPASAPERLRHALLAVLVEPIDTEALLVHPRVRGIARRHGRWVVSVDISEAAQ